MKKKNMFFLLLILMLKFSYLQSKPKVLHLTFHPGCAKEFEGVGKELNLDLTTWYINENKEVHYKFDPKPCGWNAIYNVGHERAKRIWECNKNYFEQFDVIITSDTAPLSRVFLQNGWKKGLIIWICNRFDYYDGDLDCTFPDAEYYDLMRKATKQSNVRIVGYVAYEHFYARTRGVDTGNLLIKPCGRIEDTMRHSGDSYIPTNVKKEETFFIPPRLNDPQTKHLLNICNSLGIKAYCGTYNGPHDLKDFKAIIHFPYAWSNLALFENMQLGLAHFIPSRKFLLELNRSRDRELYRFFAFDNLEYCEWYNREHGDAIIYFDSWADLKNKINTLDFGQLKRNVKEIGARHKASMLARWSTIFNELYQTK